MHTGISRIAALMLAAAAFAARGEVDASRWRLSQHAKIENGILIVDVPAERRAQGGSGRLEVDLSPYADAAFEAEIRVRGDNVSKNEISWLGSKFMVHYRNASGKDTWPQAAAVSGTFGWRTVKFRHDMAATSAQGGKGELTLGLQDASGRIEFDLSSLKFRRADPIWPRVNADRRIAYPERVSALPPLRGVMLPGGNCREEDFATLAAWGATLARYQMIRGWGRENDNQDVEEYVRWLDGRLDHLSRDVLPWARRYGVRIVVDLHVPPGGRSGSEMNMFHNAKFADCFVDCWRRIASRFRGNADVIFGYDLINEPQQMSAALPDCDYWNLQRRAAEAVRAVDPDTTIIVESNGWDSPDTFTYLSPLAMDNVIYQAHMYMPHEFTHQGVHGQWKPARYPDPERGWDMEYIRRQLAPVLAFRERHGARIYIGEFSAIAWAEGADRYIADCISLFNEYGFDWTYHAFREWQGWSVEHECDGPGKPFRPSADNARMRALKAGFSGSRPILRAMRGGK